MTIILQALIALLIWYAISVLYAHIVMGMLRFIAPEFFLKEETNWIIAGLYIPLWNLLCPSSMFIFSFAEVFWANVPQRFVKFYQWLYRIKNEY